MKRIVLPLVLLFFLLSSVASAQSEVALATVLKRSNLRSGPGTTYAIIGKANPGQTFTIVDQNEAGTWYQVIDGPADEGRDRWIAAFLVEVEVIELGKRAVEPLPPAPPPTPEVKCDPSYPDFCLGINIPDLDCGEVTWRRFRVLPPDPHRFDGDHDGMGCES